MTTSLAPETSEHALKIIPARTSLEPGGYPGIHRHKTRTKRRSAAGFGHTQMLTMLDCSFGKAAILQITAYQDKGGDPGSSQKLSALATGRPWSSTDSRKWAEHVEGRASGGGHFLPEESPDEIVSELLRFLGR